MIRDSSEILSLLLQGGHSTVAGRLAGAFRNIGRNHIADDIIKTMSAAGYTVRETDPFEESIPVLISSRERSPYVNRMNLMWQTMREEIMKHFPKPPTKPTKITEYLKRVEEAYATDAYNSLSIEGYRVSAELIQQVRRVAWNPDSNEKDRGRFLMNVMLASGGYPWTVVPLEKRNDYMAALEEASARQNIKPFNDFIASLVKKKP